MRLFRGVRRQASWCMTRPVTPEVAGSSPVAPVKSLQLGVLRCRFRRQIGADYTGFFSQQPESNHNRVGAQHQNGLRHRPRSHRRRVVDRVVLPRRSGDGRRHARALTGLPSRRGCVRRCARRNAPGGGCRRNRRRPARGRPPARLRRRAGDPRRGRPPPYRLQVDARASRGHRRRPTDAAARLLTITKSAIRRGIKELAEAIQAHRSGGCRATSETTARPNRKVCADCSAGSRASAHQQADCALIGLEAT